MSNTPKYDPALVEALAKQLRREDGGSQRFISWDNISEQYRERKRIHANHLLNAIDTCGYTVVPKDDGR